jgi:hypothetical protein
LLAPLPQRFSTPRSYYLLLARTSTTANPTLEPFRLWLAEQAGAGGGCTLSSRHPESIR